MTTLAEDYNHMVAALALARRGLGMVAPNPTVGCIIVASNGQIVGRGWTQIGGRPHAEYEAIKRAGAKCRGATAYVTLEPCDHEGKTSACSKAIINAATKKIVTNLITLTVQKFIIRVWLLLHFNSYFKGWPICDIFNIFFKITHFIWDTAHSITHKTCMTKHNICSRKITNQIFFSFKRFINRG